MARRARALGILASSWPNDWIAVRKHKKLLRKQKLKVNNLSRPLVISGQVLDVGDQEEIEKFQKRTVCTYDE